MMKHGWLFAFVTGILGCNEVVPGTCRPNTTGGAGGGGTQPIGAGVGATMSGDFVTDPPKGPLASGDCSDPCEECPKAPGKDERALEQEDLNNADGAGGVKCSTPEDCLTKCNAESKGCTATHTVHPYKPPMIGELYQCIDRFPPASAGGSYTCLYHFPNGDACIFCYGSKLGPFHLPAPPPLCVYKSP